MPFDADAAGLYNRIFAAVRAAGRSSRARLADLLIASTGRGPRLAILYARKPDDLAGLGQLATVEAV